MERRLDFQEGLDFEELKNITSNSGKHAKALLHGEVEIRNQFGTLLQKKSNIILLGGRRFVLEKLFNVELSADKKITINKDVLGLDTGNGVNTDSLESGPYQEKCVCLWGVGKGGSGDVYGTVKVPAEKEYNLYDMIPMRFVSKDNDLSETEQENYALKKEVDGKYYAYYLKKFESTPRLVIKVGEDEYTPNIDTDNLPTDWTELIERKDVDVYIELSLKLSADDVREYFIEKENGSISMARINELGTYLACPPKNSINTSLEDYSGIECFSKLCFNNEPLDDETKELFITYKFYV